MGQQAAQDCDAWKERKEVSIMKLSEGSFHAAVQKEEAQTAQQS